MTYDVYLSVGSNIHPEENVVKALRRLGKIVEIESISPVYLTRPVRVEPGAKKFHNLCVHILTNQPPQKLKGSLRSIEETVGRDRSMEKNEDDLHSSRAVDLDILLYDPEPDKFAPHSQVEDEAFVVYPLSDILDPSPWDHLPDTVEKWRANCDESTIIRTIEYGDLHALESHEEGNPSA